MHFSYALSLFFYYGVGDTYLYINDSNIARLKFCIRECESVAFAHVSCSKTKLEPFHTLF